MEDLLEDLGFASDGLAYIWYWFRGIFKGIFFPILKLLAEFGGLALLGLPLTTWKGTTDFVWIEGIYLDGWICEVHAAFDYIFL